MIDPASSVPALSVTSGFIGIAGGILVCIAGVVGIVSYKDSQNHCKNGFHMACSILAFFMSGVGIGYFSAAAG